MLQILLLLFLNFFGNFYHQSLMGFEMPPPYKALKVDDLTITISPSYEESYEQIKKTSFLLPNPISFEVSDKGEASTIKIESDVDAKALAHVILPKGTGLEVESKEINSDKIIKTKAGLVFFEKLLENVNNADGKEFHPVIKGIKDFVANSSIEKTSDKETKKTKIMNYTKKTFIILLLLIALYNNDSLTFLLDKKIPKIRSISIKRLIISGAEAGIIGFIHYLLFNAPKNMNLTALEYLQNPGNNPFVTIPVDFQISVLKKDGAATSATHLNYRYFVTLKKKAKAAVE